MLAHSSDTTTADKTPPPNQSVDEERLGRSAREALAKAHPLLKKLNLAPTEHHGDTPPESSTRAVSSGVPEDAPAPGSCSDERVELTDHGLLGTAVHHPPISVEEHTPVAHSDNPLNPLKTSLHAYPAVYQPSQPTSDPFVVVPHAWLRDHRTNTRESIGPTAEAVADTLSGFDRMDIDAPSEKMKGGRLPRNVSSELYGIWFSNESTIPLPCSSRAGLSPLFSDAERSTSSEALKAHLDAPSGCTVEMPENAVSLASGASSGASTK
ncbi:hypothetical protein JB92DRAFT_3120676 [Gautieria morchelliformis]|nr:hypothetical protein JB92DRAFT_3120676 [Gautieria morchelliformis]